MDNLNDPKIRGLVNQITSESANIQRAMRYCLKCGNKANDEIEKDALKQRSAAIRTALLSRRKTAKQAVETDAIKDLSPAAQESTQTIANLSDGDLDAMIAEDIKKQKAKIVEGIKKDLAVRETYLELYAKKMKIKLDQIDMAAFLEQYQKLQADIEGNIKAIMEKADKCTAVGLNAAETSLAQAERDRELGKENARLIVEFIYSDEDFQELVRQSIEAKFSNGRLEFDPNPEPLLPVPTYPQMSAEMNGYNIYAWVKKSQFDEMQAAPGASPTKAIHISEDGKYVLVNYLPLSPNDKDVGITNNSGNHFEKWIDVDDYPRLARAVRHQRLHGVNNTR